MWNTVQTLGEVVIACPVTQRKYNVQPGCHNYHHPHGGATVFSPNWDKSVMISLANEVWYKPDEATPYTKAPEGGIGPFVQDLATPVEE